ncbi:MAG: alpha/beta fold hydrolase [Deltaproteobacteria bacterium]|nr:alpha/beta fold hydrolase [Deltaproteobacteria bacterium]
MSPRLVPFFAVACAGCLSWHQGQMPGEPRDATYAALSEGGKALRVRYRDQGPQGAPVVVLLHGFASALETWAAVAPRLARAHRVISLDLKGFGWTDRPAGDYSPQAQAKLVLALLDQRGVDRFSVVGHSWGSSVALAAALAAPERVQRVALYDAWVFEDQLPAFFRWARMDGVGEALFGLFYKERADDRLVRAFFDPTMVREAFVEEVERALQRPGTVAAALAAARGQRFADLQGRWAQVKQPTLLLWGREDAVSWLEFGERLASLLPDARLRVFPRCGHFPMIEAAEASSTALEAFLRGEAVP